MNYYKIILFILVIFSNTGNVLSKENLFNVNNIELTKNPNTSSEKMANKAIKLGFDELMNKILLKDDYEKILKSNISEIKQFVSYYQIKKNSNKEEDSNKVVFNIFFDKEKLHSLFYKRNIFYSDIADKELYLLPVLIKNNQIYIFNQNFFYQNWNSSNNNNNLIEFILPIENIEVIQNINLNKENLLDLDLGILFKEYSNKNLALVIIEELDNKIKSTDIAYYIGPCINAAGRIGDPFLGFNLLVKNQKSELEIIAEKLINSNNERKTLENISYNQAKMLLKNLTNMKFIFLSSKTWHPGIIGIMASRLVQEYKVPAFVMNIDENKVTGSVRSIKNIDISKILAKLVDEGFLESGGGHAMAGGFKLKEEKLSSLQNYLKENSYVFFKSENSTINIDLEAKISDLNLEMINSMEQLEPFGMGYPEPKILIKKVSSVYSKIIGKNKTHLSCTLEDIYGYRINAMIFNFENSILRVIEEKREFDVIGKVSLNIWENKKIPQFFIEDLRII